MPARASSSDRSTLADWVGGACWWLEPLHERLLQERVRLRPAVRRRHADPGARSRPRPHQDRPALGLCPRRPALGRTRSAGGGLLSTRRTARPSGRSRISNGFKGVLQVDGYAGFEQLAGSGDVVLAFCWAHARRKFYEVAEATGSPIAAEALRRIAALYAIEARDPRPIADAAARRAASRRARPLVEALQAWLEAELPRLIGRSKLAEAIRYALSRWEA